MKTAFLVSLLLLAGVVLAEEEYPEPPNGDDCLLACPRNFEPVCGQSQSDGGYKTFANKCFLRYLNCVDKTDYQFVARGFCEEYGENETGETGYGKMLKASS